MNTNKQKAIDNQDVNKIHQNWNVRKVDDNKYIYDKGNNSSLKTLESCSVKNHLCLFPHCDQSDCWSIQNIFQASTPRCLVAPGFPVSSERAALVNALMWHHNHAQVHFLCFTEQQQQAACGGRCQHWCVLRKLYILFECMLVRHHVYIPCVFWVRKDLITLIHKMKPCALLLRSGLYF